MAGFNYEAGRSNNMVTAETAGKVTIGRWAKMYGVSARAAVEVMQPSEAHHTGTGFRGKSRLTPVIAGNCEPTPEQLVAMKVWDFGQRAPVQGWYTDWRTERGNYGRRLNIPVLGIFRGDPAEAPKGLEPLNDAAYAVAVANAGKRLKPYASSPAELAD